MTPTPNPPRKERLAVNVKDIARLDEATRGRMFADRLDLGRVLDIGKQRDKEQGWAFCCDLTESAKVCDALRDEDRKAKRKATRIYVQRGRGWTKMPDKDQLTVTVKGEEGEWLQVLNPDHFPPAPAE